jgi:hypothetical protein
MPKIAYTATGFPAPLDTVNGVSDLELSWSFLLRSAISVGRAELLHIFRYGQFSLFEIAYRAAMVFANLCDNGAGRIRRSEAYDGLDPSEKSAISYFFGLTMAKAFSERLLGAPWLMHLDVYREQLKPALAGKSRPDLVGQTAAGDWIGIESKGRTHGFDSNALDRVKAQAGMLESVDEQTPLALMGMVTHFGDNELQVVARDPPPRRSTGAPGLAGRRRREAQDLGQLFLGVDDGFGLFQPPPQPGVVTLQLGHPARHVAPRPELLATGPNEVWSWDITKLLGPVKWTYYYLYVILDIFSRYVVGWMVAHAESARLAERLIAATCETQGIAPVS